MAQRKLSDEFAKAKSPQNLEVGEKIVETRTIEKQVSANETETPEEVQKPKEISNDLEDFGDFEIVEDDEDEIFPAGTPAARIFGSNKEQNFSEMRCNVLVFRKPDGLGDNFRTSCNARKSYPPLRNIDILMPENEIEELVRFHYDGGHYYLQYQLNNKLKNGWDVTLADKIEQPQTTAQMPMTAEPAQPTEPPKSDLDTFLETLAKQKQMKDLLFGDELRELQELRKQITDNQNNHAPNTPRLSDLQIVLNHLEKNNNPTIADKLLGYVFPEEEKNTGGILDTVKFIFENKAEVISFGQMLFGGLLGGGGMNIEEMLKKAAPNHAGQIAAPENHALPTSTFRRKTAPVETAETTEKIDDETK